MEVEYMPSTKELQEKKNKLAEKVLEIEALIPEAEAIEDKVNALGKFLKSRPIEDERDTLVALSKHMNINLSEAKNLLNDRPVSPTMDGMILPDLVKELRQTRRTLKGDMRIKFSGAIENIVKEYTNHLYDIQKCNELYWLHKYSRPLSNMKFNESDLYKLCEVKDRNTRSTIIDSLCKYWEAELEMRNLSYGSRYGTLMKTQTQARKEFREIVKGLDDINKGRKSLSQQLENHIIKSVCDNQGISAREIHEGLPVKLYKSTTANMIHKRANKLGITNIDGQYFKLPDEIKKDLYAYTAGMIDSDGYITMDSNFNPRIAITATGERGKAFCIELQKALGFGKLHLDQKSPQDTRSVQRLAFYSQKDIGELLSKCGHHLRMKGAQSDALLEVVRIKKNFKKEKWAKDRILELFKIIKYENHKDASNTWEFDKYQIDPTEIAKFKENSKMSIMDELEGIKK